MTKSKAKLMQAIIQMQDEYIQELSQSFENRNYGKRPEIMYECYRKYVHIISDLKKQLEEYPTKTVTSSTIGSENNCNNCKWGICLTKDWPCNDCDGSNKWEPINE